ncbi:hypothetical protein WJX84_003650 [Apatococcus fuscideae]|uniref:phenylalanine--tRNA ligase n=1 Tax=Apatococcus fuscideae TaxID=2026836 RepID=A0AAW1SWH6_9CHLO
MPIVSVGRDKLFEALGEQFTDESFDELCFEYGIELDDVTSEQEMLQKGQGHAGETSCSSEEVLYKIDIPANRYDMLCLEGIARALNIFRGHIHNVQYTLGLPPGQKPLRMVVKPETALVRPFVACAVLRGITLDPVRYTSFLDLQDKLHQNLCRQRSLVAIGTHDLSTLQAPFTYEARPPADITFVPLKQQQEFSAAALLQHYLDHDQKLKKFVPIIKDSVVYPVLYDSRRTVLSLPPVINGAHSAISVDTKDVFIEVTGTDEVKTHTVLNMVCTMFSEYCKMPYQIEPVEVVDAFGHSQQTPRLQSRELDVEVSYISGCTGLDLKAGKMAELLSRMALSAKASSDGSSVHVQVPPTRSDVLHPCDVMEDVAIAFGFNNLNEKRR